MASRTPQASVDRRLALLKALLDGPFEDNHAELGRRLGYKDGSIIGQWLRGDRPITEASEEKITALPESRRLVLKHGEGETRVAQPVGDLITNLPSPRSWEEVMHRDRMPTWPAEAIVVVPDQALEPHVMKGDHLTFEACNTADPTNVVIIELNDGSRWMRRLVRRADGSLWGATTTDAFPEYEARRIIAKAIRRSSPFSGF